MKPRRPTSAQVKTGTYLVNVTLDAGTTRIKGLPMHPELFSNLKGRHRALLNFNRTRGHQGESSLRGFLKLPRCARVKYRYTLDGNRMCTGYFVKLPGRVQNSNQASRLPKLMTKPR